MGLFSRLVVVGAALGALAGCDQKPTEAPVVAAPVAAAPAPPPAPKPLLPAEALAAIDQPVLCGLFARAMSDDKVKVPAEGCAITSGASDLTITSKDGAQSLVVPLVVSGQTVQLTAANASPRAIADASGGFSNIGMVFIARADDKPLCLSVEYIAPDGSSNSIFIGREAAKKPVRFDLPLSSALAKVDRPEEIFTSARIRAFDLTRREPDTVIKSVSFRGC